MLRVLPVTWEARVSPRILFAFTFVASLCSVPAFAQDEGPTPLPSVPPLPAPASSPVPPPPPPAPLVEVRPAPPAGATPTPAPPASQRSVWIHIDSSRTVMLQHLAPFDTTWRATCFSPCDSIAPLDGTYRVVAPGIVWSREVELEAQPGDKVVLEIHARTLEQRRTAEALGIASYVAGGIGLGLEIGAISVSSSTAQTALVAAGVGAAVTGLTLVITSLVLNRPTGISQSAFKPVAGSTVEPPARQAEAQAHDGDLRGGWLPRAMNVPVLTLTF
jgi:hypothetical protein